LREEALKHILEKNPFFRKLSLEVRELQLFLLARLMYNKMPNFDVNVLGLHLQRAAAGAAQRPVSDCSTVLPGKTADVDSTTWIWFFQLGQSS